MALGALADINLVDEAVLSGGTWAAGLPLANLKAADYVARPARCEDPSNLAKSQFQAQLEWPQSVSLVGVVFHTLSRSAAYRLTIAGPDLDLGAPVYQSEWTPVIPRLWQSRDLPWGSPNWWTGQPLARDLDLYPRNLWIALPAPVLCGVLRLEIDDRENLAGYFDLGGLWIVDPWRPTLNFERGRDLSIEIRSLVDEAPSGRIYGETRRSRRQLAVTWAMLTANEANRLYDAGMRAGTTKPVLFVPDQDDGASLLRECWPATFGAPPAPKFGWEGLHTVSATFREIIA
ncbi:hypothetical protein [Caulobacter segnis]|uniref:Uncharacterized protein n=1 Tax=Caulobacter segnis TaxID=88688 RepID=A0A2W5WFB2_9CAUL|nr:hypothetical protein [Caulobacter segnis]PZR32298.1 MAG: hypothetical protein DI526_17135 [Caulobacter segnis]